MRVMPTKVRRRRQPDELRIEQSHDRALIQTMLDLAAFGFEKIAHTPECFLIAYLGEDPAGIAGLQTEVDAALMSPIFVVNEMRQRTIGASLISAVRRAAYARGARTLYTIVPASLADYFARLGFAEATGADLYHAFGQTSTLHCASCDMKACRRLRLDLSQDGFVARRPSSGR